MTTLYLRSAAVVLALLIVQTVFLSFVAIEGIVPDLLLIWIVYVAIARGQLHATVAGFVVGLVQDVVTTQFFGLAALAKTVGGFVGGYFFNENKTDLTLGTYRFVAVVAICSLVHNLIYFGIFFQGETLMLGRVVQATVGTTVYTVVLSALPMFGFSRRLLAT